jgi:hypothetical protein
MKTSVEFLVKELSDILGPIETSGMQDLLMIDAIKKAKEMHKKEVYNSYKRGQRHKKPLKDSNPIKW